ncbi:hemolysin family protein [Halocalculus aciditolerans]|uniref:DNA-binding protein n=1 Tax=Halocalculus aciditolerans TaxID=1383812 RepID=A0A830FEL6_9EURY|nr:hemolysin family protein [Halocalculus aciditolerans]GGL47643.1 DNA-binding protein [Halocalculus aciditolerans]
MGHTAAVLVETVLGVTLSTDVIAAMGVAVMIVLMGLSAFFSSSEIALFSLARHRVESLAEEGVPGAATVMELKSDPHRLLITILVGNNLVNIAMSSIATALVGMYLTNAGVAVLVSTFGVTALVLLFGESAPKSYAVENTESWSLRIARPLQASEKILYPLIVLFDHLTRVVNRLTGGGAAIESSYVSRDEIQEMIRTGEREGVIEEDEREMLQRIFRFNNTIAKEVMTPRLDVDAVDTDTTVPEAIEACVESGHELLPVYEGNLDNIVGTVSLRDLVRERRYGEGDPLDLSALVQPTLHVPESKNVNELLEEMQDERVQMVVVIDEFGTTEGILTTEDLIEEIVGEILEGEEERPVTFVDDNSVLVNGEVNIDEVNEALEIDLPEGEEFETIAGFIFNRAGRLVDAGETFDYENVELRVEQVENTRIRKARVTKHPVENDENAAADADERESNE